MGWVPDGVCSCDLAAILKGICWSANWWWSGSMKLACFADGSCIRCLENFQRCVRKGVKSCVSCDHVKQISHLLQNRLWFSLWGPFLLFFCGVTGKSLVRCKYPVTSVMSAVAFALGKSLHFCLVSVSINRDAVLRCILPLKQVGTEEFWVSVAWINEKYETPLFYRDLKFGRTLVVASEMLHGHERDCFCPKNTHFNLLRNVPS